MAAAPAKDPTVVATPFYFATMAAEHLVLRRRAALEGPSAADYERRDTVASLTMGVLSLIAPMATRRALRPFTPGRGRYGRAVVALAAGAAVATTAADAVARHRAWGRPRAQAAARRVATVGGVATVVLGGTAVATAWQEATSVARLAALRQARRPASRQPSRVFGRLAGGPGTALTVAGWDAIYYWNHRLAHEIRYMWAVHVVHHSSEHYNLSTALRQPVLDVFGTPLPYGALAVIGATADQINLARGINLLYQYWIHTETVGRLGPAERVLNTPSHHRVHHGSNRRYIDRNHGSILIVWDRLFGTFEPETDDVIYGLTRNIDTFNAGRIATHEFGSILADVARSTTWRDRLSFVARGPGWADRRRRELASAAPAGAGRQQSEPAPAGAGRS